MPLQIGNSLFCNRQKRDKQVEITCTKRRKYKRSETEETKRTDRQIDGEFRPFARPGQERSAQSHNPSIWAFLGGGRVCLGFGFGFGFEFGFEIGFEVRIRK